MPRTITAFTSVYGYDPTGAETDLLFTERKIREYIASVVAGYEATKAAEAARQAALASPILVEAG